MSPAEPPRFDNLTPDTIRAETQQVLRTTSVLHDLLVATFTPVSATFQNVVRPIVDDANKAACRLNILSELLAQSSPDPKVRQAARESEASIMAARSRNLARKDVAALVIGVHAKATTESRENLDEQDRHLLSVIHGRYVRSGAGLLTEGDRKRFREASDELGKICAAAQNTLVEPEQGVWFERTELDGVPEPILATMLEDCTRLQATFRRDHANAILSYATRSETRRRFAIADWHRLPENVERLADAVALRDEIARLLQFDHHAALKMETRMAPSVGYVEAQLQELHDRLRPVAQAETNRLLELKKADPAMSDHPVSTVYAWDSAYYSRKLRRDSSVVDHSRLAEYFEARNTLQAMLMLFRDLFGMDFKPFKTSVWHDSVMPYQVWDTPSEGGGFLGYLYVDLFEREGKYRGAHCIGVQPSFTEHSGIKHYPAAVLVCCYANPSQSSPTLLQHSEVTTMFHELGHAIHNLVGKTKYDIGRSRDYSEIPSNMLENWTWIPEVLVRLGKHYTTLGDESDTTGVLPRDFAEAVCATRNLRRANVILNHVWPALFDLAIHSPPTHEVAVNMDTTKIWNTTKQRSITTNCGDGPRDWGAGQARFIHMFRHNDVGYFSYPLSMAYAADIFASTFARDPMCAIISRRWRYEVLEPGASRPEMEILKGFLGRAPSTKAVLDELKA